VDFAGRIGGDEFAVLLAETDVDAAMMFAERLRLKAAVTSVSIGERQVSIAVTIGIATISAADATAELVLQRAADALTRAKLSGGGRIEVADAPDAVTLMPSYQVAPEKRRAEDLVHQGEKM